MTLHSNDGSRALVVPAVPLRKHQRRFFPTLRSYVSVARGDSRRRHETELCRQGSGRASAELVRMRGKRLVYRDPMRQPHSGAREISEKEARVRPRAQSPYPAGRDLTRPCTLRRAGLPCFECRNTSRGYGASPLYFPTNPGPSPPDGATMAAV